MLSVKQAAKELGIKAGVLLRNIEDEKIPVIYQDNEPYLDEKTVEEIRWQKEHLTGIVEIMDTYGNGRADTGKVKTVRDFLAFITSNDFFGCQIWYDNQVYFERTGKNVAYFLTEDVPKILNGSAKFLADYGYSVEELYEREREKAKGKDFEHDYEQFARRGVVSMASQNMYLEVLASLNDLDCPFAEISNEDLIRMKDSYTLKGSADVLLRFSRYFKERNDTNYNFAIKEPKPLLPTVSSGSSAYSNEVVARLAGLIFNERYIREHSLLEKAFDRNFDAEMWLYISCFFVCDWRAGDITSKWLYPDLKESPMLFPEIDRAHIREDILSDVYDDSLYIRVCDYVTKRIELSNALPSKTEERGPAALKVGLAYKNMRVFFGRLYLICEYHNLTTGEGRMKSGRRTMYANRVSLENFFGKEIGNVLERENFQPTKMNKTFAQAIEKMGRTIGYSPVMAHILASSARSHTSLETMSYYLSDHGFDGETPSFVLEQMMERGTWSVLKTNAFRAMLPEEFGLLPEEVKTDVLNLSGLSPLEMESISTLTVVIDALRKKLKGADVVSAKRIYQGMSEIMQGFHRGKQEGCGCIAIAMGYECPHMTWDCIADACEFCIATELALPALYSVIKDMSDRYKETHDPKIKAVYTKKIVPAFNELINEMFRQLTEEQKASLVLITKEKADGK